MEHRGRGKGRKSSSDSKNGRASAVELFSREIIADTNTSSKIYSRDADNLYPIRMERVVNNSPTGKRCARLMSRYISGNGNKINYKIGRKNGVDYFINDLISEAADFIPVQGGVYIHVKYVLDITASSGKNIVFTRGEVDVLDYALMARSKEDDLQNEGKYYKLSLDADGQVDGTDNDLENFFYPFSSDNKVILAQMRADCKAKNIENPSIEQLIRNQRGQVLYINLTPAYVYALPHGDCVYNDMDTEYRISIYNNTQTRLGFLGKTILVRYETPNEEDDDFEDEVQEFLGVENSGSVMIVEIPEEAQGKLEDAFVIKQLKPQFDDKLFESTIKNIRQNILGAFNNIPEPLVFSASGALFGTSADTYNEMKLFYWEQNEPERSALERGLRLLGFDVDILPIVEETKTKTDA